MVRKVRRASVSIYAIRPPQRAADETGIVAARLLACFYRPSAAFRIMRSLRKRV